MKVLSRSTHGAGRLPKPRGCGRQLLASMHRGSVLPSLVLTALVLLGGCRGGIDPQEELAKANATNLQRLASLYWTFQSEHNWMGPKDEASFRKFIQSYNRDQLARVGVDADSIDGLFVCSRDNEPFKFRWSVMGSMMGSSEPVVFESTGVDGQRRVGFLNMEQQEVDAARYDLLWTGQATFDDNATPSRR